MIPRQTRAGPKSRTQDVNNIHKELGSSNPRRSDLFQSAPWWEKREPRIDRGPSCREQLIEKDQHIARLQDMLRAEREKVRSSQQEAELRRCEQLRDRLREHLHPRQRRELRPSSIEVLNLVPGYGGEGEQENKLARFTTQQEVTALRVMLERREAELRAALKLRHSTTTLLHALRRHMEQTLQDLHPQEALRNRLNQLVQAEAQMGDHVTGGVARSWLTVQKRLGLYLEGHPAVGTDQDRLAELETELEKSQDLVKLQQRLLQDGLFSPVPSRLADCYFLEEWDRLQARRAELRLQRRNFERERQSFTDAAVRLGRQQRDFDQEKATLLKQQFLGDSLFFCHAKVLHSSNNRESTALGLEPPSVPCGCSASPSSTESASSVEAGYGSGQRRRRVSVRTPSTPELYSALNLPYTCGGEGDCRSENCLESTQRTHLQHLDWSF